jgi:tripeptidyl-peptidase-1
VVALNSVVHANFQMSRSHVVTQRLLSNVECPRALVFLARNKTAAAELAAWVHTHSNPLDTRAFQAPHLRSEEVNARLFSPAAWNALSHAVQNTAWHCTLPQGGGDVATCVMDKCDYWQTNPQHGIDTFEAFRSLAFRTSAVELVIPQGPWRAVLPMPPMRSTMLREHRARRWKARNIISSDLWVTPATLWATYGVNATQPLRGRGGVIEFEDNPPYCPQDLVAFQNNWGMRPATVSTNGPFVPSTCPDAESSLDIQYFAAAAPGVENLSYWTVDEWVVDGAFSLFNASENARPAIITASWGWCEHAQCDVASCDNSSLYVQRAEHELAKLAAVGTLFVAADGDSGCKGRKHWMCDGGASCCSPYPTASAWVLSVGGTDFLGGLPDDASSPVCAPHGTLPCMDRARSQRPCMSVNDGWNTGGGFSDLVQQPPWQAVLARMYLSNPEVWHAPEFNAGGRATPDVVAVGHNLAVVMYSVYAAVDGTSASTPIVGGLLMAVNDLYVDTPRRSLGFGALPMLYASAVTCDGCLVGVDMQGNNNCTEQACCKEGWQSWPLGAWDPVAGLGTPHAGKLRAHLGA